MILQIILSLFCKLFCYHFANHFGQFEKKGAVPRLRLQLLTVMVATRGQINPRSQRQSSLVATKTTTIYLYNPLKKRKSKADLSTALGTSKNNLERITPHPKNIVLKVY